MLEIVDQNNYNMRPFIQTSQGESGYILQSRASPQLSAVQLPTNGRSRSRPGHSKKTKSKQRQQQVLNPGSSDPLFKVISVSSFSNSEEVFKQDKWSFLQQIRKYTPEGEFQKQWEREKQLKELDSTKQLDMTPKTSDNSNFSVLLENMSSEVFSEMFVSSSIRGKIMMSGFLGSISQVKSEMEISSPTETIINNLQFTQQR